MSDIRTYPKNTKNPNVPKGVFLLAEDEGTVYYINSNSLILKVGPEKNAQPQVAYKPEICRVTGDTMDTIDFRYRQFCEAK